jgi:SAM-dependent methyltransferase
MLSGRTGLSAIEIGVGPMGVGFLSVYVGEHCGRIVGVEPLPIAPPAIADAGLAAYLQALRGRVQILQAKAEQLSLADASFDLACCINVLDHTDAPEKVLVELARLVRPGGLLALAVHTRSVLGLGKWQIDRRLHAGDLFYRAHPHAFLWPHVARLLRPQWETIWCDRPRSKERAVGHQRMSSWILRKRESGFGDRVARWDSGVNTG